MLIFPAANDLLTLFIALEVFSLPLYILCALARRQRLLSQEAAVKYFLLGAFSSAFLLFGVALLYGYAGTVTYAGIAEVVSDGAKQIDPALAGTMGNDALLLIGAALVLMGLLFKVGAVPFHMWTPDVYQGAPTPVTGFMAAATKVAAFGALLRLLYVVLPGLRWDWRPVMWGVAILTMLGGAIVAITQTDIKRLLAYSSIAHAGFLLAGVIATSEDGVSSVLFYLGAYSFVTLGAFAVVTLVRDAGGEATALSKWAGLGRRSPLVAAVFAVFLLAFAGIPLTSGFAGKFAVFKAAAQSGAGWLVVVGVLSSAIAAFFYIRVIVLMFFSEPKADGPTVAVPSPLTTTAIAVGVTATLVLGLAPQYFLDLARPGRRSSCAEHGGPAARRRPPPGTLGGLRAAAVAVRRQRSALGRAWLGSVRECVRGRAGLGELLGGAVLPVDGQGLAVRAGLEGAHGAGGVPVGALEGSHGHPAHLLDLAQAGGLVPVAEGDGALADHEDQRLVGRAGLPGALDRAGPRTCRRLPESTAHPAAPCSACCRCRCRRCFRSR